MLFYNKIIILHLLYLTVNEMDSSLSNGILYLLTVYPNNFELENLLWY